jgi:MFS family permease
MGCCQACWGHSGIILGLTTAARYAPVLLLSPYAGLLVDRYSKRRVLLATQAGLGLVSAALGAAVLTGDVRLWQVVVLAVLFGTFSAAACLAAAIIGGWPGGGLRQNTPQPRGVAGQTRCRPPLAQMQEEL